MTRTIARISLGVLALISLIVFIVELRSSRNDATPIAQACFVMFILFSALGWTTRRKR